MAKTIVRSLRIDEELKDNLDRLPDGTVNTLVNELLELFFQNKDIQKMVILRDNRFNTENWKPESVIESATEQEIAEAEQQVEAVTGEKPTEEEVIQALGGTVVDDIPVVGPIQSAEPVQKPVESVDKSSDTLDNLFGL